MLNPRLCIFYPLILVYVKKQRTWALFQNFRMKACFPVVVFQGWKVPVPLYAWLGVRAGCCLGWRLCGSDSKVCLQCRRPRRFHP